MIDDFIDSISSDTKLLKQFKNAFHVKEVPAKTVFLNEGEIAANMYFVKKGCLREWFTKDDKDITYQFFFEGQAVSSLESFMNNTPSLFTIQSIEPSVVFSIKKEAFLSLIDINQKLKDHFNNGLIQILFLYRQLYLSRIRDTPQERYEQLLKTSPEIVKRIPQHYIASYLGITPVSLSRIRNRI